VTAVALRGPVGALPASAATARTRDRLTPVFAVLCLVATFAIGYVDLGKRELWNDEFATWHGATLNVHQMRMFVGNIDLVHALYYLVMHAWIPLAGDSPGRLRLLSLLSCAGTAALLVVVGNRLFGRITVGPVAALLYAVLPVTSRYAQEARSYALVTFMALLATWLLLHAANRPTRWRWALYGAAIVLVGWLHFVALLVLAGHLALVLTTSDKREWRWQWAVASGYAGLFVLPLLVFASHQSGQVSWVKGDLAAVRKVLTELVGGPWTLGIASGLMLLGVLLARRHRPVILMLLVWVVLPPVFGYATVSILHLFMARYFLFTVPALCLLLSFGAHEAGSLLGFRRVALLGPVAALACVAAVAYLGLPAQHRIRQPTLEGQPTYVSATRYVAAHTEPGDGVAFNDGFGGSTDLARKATDYQFRGRSDRPRDVFLAQSARSRGWLTALQCVDAAACLGATKRIWLLETGHAGGSFQGLPEARATLLQRQFVVRHIEKFTGIRVLELERRTAT
jgi:mannosyltransferase